MAKYRQIHTKIWKDEWFLDLPPKQKLFFVYLFSNEMATVAGIYPLPLRVMAFESGLSNEEIETAFKVFQEAGKAFYEDGVVWVKNLRAYHETTSKLLQKGIQNEVDAVKDCPLKQRYLAYYGDWQESEPEPEEKPKKADSEKGVNDLGNIPFEGNGRGREGIDRVSIPSNSLISSQLPSNSGVVVSGDGGVGEGVRLADDRELLAFLKANDIPLPESDEDRRNVTHKAVAAWLLATHYWPSYNVLPLLIERIGDKPNLEALKQARLLWLGSGHKPTNHVGVLDWYDNICANPSWQPSDQYAPRASPKTHENGTNETAEQRAQRILEKVKR